MIPQYGERPKQTHFSCVREVARFDELREGSGRCECVDCVLSKVGRFGCVERKEREKKRKEKRKFEIFLETTLVIFIGCWSNRKRSVFFFRLAVLSVEVDVCG